MLRELTRELDASRHLTEDESSQAMELILSEETDDRNISTFLTALHAKGETSSEIAGFARVMKRHAVSLHCQHQKFIDTAGTGGGANTFNVSTAAAFVISGAGLPVAKHGNRAATSQCGSADVLQSLGVKVEHSTKVAQRSLNELGLAFLFAPLFHPAMKRVSEIRRQLSHRTIFNLVGPLTNPAEAPFQIIGVYSKELTLIMGQALASLGCKRAWVVHSQDGLDELSTAAPTQVADVNDKQVRNFLFTPTSHSLNPMDHEAVAGGCPERNAWIIREILEGNLRESQRDLVLLNAAAGLHVAGESDFGKALEQAAESIDSGAALRKLDQLIEAYAG